MKFKNNVKFILAASTVLIALVMQMIMLPSFKTNQVAQAASFTEVTLSNSDFNSSPSSYYLDTSPTGWTKTHSNSGATAGVINTNDDNFSSYTQTYELTTNPQTMYVDTADTKVLMINAKNNDSRTGSYALGFTSSTMTLEAYSYYSISVLAKTEVGANASIYLNGFEENQNVIPAQTSFELFQETSWTEYTFYIQTGTLSSSVSLDLWLGSKTSVKSANAVFFDNISVNKLSENYYTDNSSNNATSNIISLDKQYLTSVDNADFETGNVNDGWTNVTQLPTNAIQRVINTSQAQIMTAEGFNALGTDNSNGTYALWLAAEEANSEFGVKSTDLQIERFGIYKISVNVKVDEDTVAKVLLIENDDVIDFYENAGISEDYYSYEAQTSTQTITKNSNNELLNNYTTYSFYVKGHALFDTSVHLELMLTSESENQASVNGSALFDNITFEKLSQEEYDYASENDSDQEFIALSTLSPELSIENGTFNNALTNKTSNTFPLTPENWTSSVSNEDANVYGIINTNQAHYDANKANYGNLANPGNPQGFLQDVSKETNNVLMLWNKEVSYQSITSEDFELTTESYAKLTFDYKVISPGTNLNVKLYTDEGVVAFEEEYLPFTTWNNYSIIIKTYKGITDLNIQFSLGTQEEPTAGFAFIDNVSFQTLGSSEYEEANFTQDQNNQTQTYKTLDLTNLLLNTRLVQNEDGTYKLSSLAGKLESGVQGNGDAIAEAGLVDGGANAFEVVSSPENNDLYKNLFYIKTNGEATYSLTTTVTKELNPSTIYEFSVYVKTNLPQVEDDYENDYGFSFEIEGLQESSINYIKSNEEWQKLTIVVYSTTNTDTNIKFSLTSQNQTAGIVFFDNIQIQEIGAVEYEAYTQTFENEEPNDLLVIGSTDWEEDNEQPEDEEEDTPSSFNWLIVPSLLFGVALVFAIAGTLLRRISFKKFVTRKTNEYDRNKTLYRDVIRKEAEDRRNDEVKKLNEHLKELENQLEEIEKDHKAKAKASRRGQVDRATQKEFKAYASKHTKLENQKERIVERIKDANSAEYLLSLQKKISAEKLKKQLEKPKK